MSGITECSFRMPRAESTAHDAPLALDTLNFFPVIALSGKLGDTYRVDYSTAVAPTTWTPLSTNKLIISPQYIIDTTSPLNNTRFYREVFLY